MKCFPVSQWDKKNIFFRKLYTLFAYILADRDCILGYSIKCWPVAEVLAT